MRQRGEIKGTNGIKFGEENPELLKALMITSGGLSGGISSNIAGGKFWDGFRQGIITAGLNHVGHFVTSMIENGNLEYNDESLTKWSKKTFKDVKGIDKIKIKTGKAPKGREYRDGKILAPDKDGNYTINEWGIGDGNDLYISEYTFSKGIEWLYLVTGHEIMHYSFSVIFNNLSLSNQHATIFDWQIKQLEKWGISEGWMLDQSKGSLNSILKRFPNSLENASKYNRTWESTGMKLINAIP